MPTYLVNNRTDAKRNVNDMRPIDRGDDTLINLKLQETVTVSATKATMFLTMAGLIILLLRNLR